MHFSSFRPMDRTLSGATTVGKSGSGGDANEGYSAFPKVQDLLVPHHQIVNVISKKLAEGILTFCSDAVSVFCNPSRLGHIWFQVINNHYSSSSCNATSTDVPDPFTTGRYRLWQEVFQAIFYIGTEMLYIGSSWSFYVGSSMWTDPLD